MKLGSYPYLLGKLAFGLFTIFLFMANPNFCRGQDMTPDKMKAVVQSVGDSVVTKGSFMRFKFQSVYINLIFDETHDRMRLVSPIIEVKNIADSQMMKMLKANYHDALDARYAVSEGIVWSTFIHPLSDLTEEYLKSAIRQVAVAKATFGRGYSSGTLQFGGGE